MIIQLGISKVGRSSSPYGGLLAYERLLAQRIREKASVVNTNRSKELIAKTVDSIIFIPELTRSVLRRA